MSSDPVKIRLPKHLERAKIEIESDGYVVSHEYDKKLEEDFERNRAEYHEVMLHGVPVLVKVKAKL